jgi:hypothetical protein
VAPVKWRSGLRDLPNAVLATRECGNSRDSSLGRCIEVIQTVTDPLTRISVAIQHGRSPEAMNSQPRGQLASVSSTQSNRLMSLKDEIPPAEVSPSQVSRYFDYPPTYSNHPRRCASSIPLQTGIPVTPAFGFRIPTPRSEILQLFDLKVMYKTRNSIVSTPPDLCDCWNTWMNLQHHRSTLKPDARTLIENSPLILIVAWPTFILATPLIFQPHSSELSSSGIFITDAN